MAKITWILVANSSHAKLYKTAKPYHSFSLVKEFFHPESREKISNLVSDNQGRYRALNSVPSGRYQEMLNPKQVEALKFAHELATEINLGRTRGEYVHLILVVPSHFKGLLNKHFDRQVLNTIVYTLDKDYTKFTSRDLSKHLDGEMFWQHAA